MKDSLLGYYRPSPDELTRHLEQSTIVLDTNVLFGLYRLPSQARKEVLNILIQVKERLWIPYHVALEFQRRRLHVIASEHKSVSEALSACDKLAQEVKSKVELLKLDQRDLNINPTDLLAEIFKAKDALALALRNAQSDLLPVSGDDPIRNELDALFEGRVGAAPQTQDEIYALTLNGADRYTHKIPPGFLDEDKEKNPNEATFFDNGLKYERKFGDLIIWMQLLAHMRSTKTTSVLFVTGERKEDWWWKEQGQIIGPLPELIQEAKRDGGIDRFWMYSLEQFAEYAGKHFSATLSEDSVSKLRALPDEDTRRPNRSVITNDNDADIDAYNRRQAPFIISNRRKQIYEDAVLTWLLQAGLPATLNRGAFPDILVGTSGDLQSGYEVKTVSDIRSYLRSPLLQNILARGYVEVGENRLANFALVLILEDSIVDPTYLQSDDIYDRLQKLLDRYPIEQIIIGTFADDSFNPIFGMLGKWRS